jgi:hypothetical protein
MEVRRINADVDSMITGALQENPRVAKPDPWPQYARTRDGVEYRIRPIRPDDRERDRTLVAGLSTQPRFCSPMQRRTACVACMPSSWRTINGC